MVKRLETTNLKSRVENESFNWGAVSFVIVFLYSFTYSVCNKCQKM